MIAAVSKCTAQTVRRTLADRETSRYTTSYVSFAIVSNLHAKLRVKRNPLHGDDDDDKSTFYVR